MRLPLIVTLAASSLLSACAVVSSTRQAADFADAPKNGISYFLPKGKVVVTLSWNPKTCSWDARAEVVFEPDTQERFNLDWTDNYCFDDDVTVAVDPTTGLLETLNAASTGANVNTVGSIIGSAGNRVDYGQMIASVAAPQGPDASPEFYPSTPSDMLPESAQVELNEEAPSHAAVFLASPASQSGGQRRAGPRTYAAVSVTMKKRFELGPGFPNNKDRAVPTDGKAKGLVIRVPIPYELSVVEVVSTEPTFRHPTTPHLTYAISPRILMLPDSRHDCILPITRRPLVADNTKVLLVNGMVFSLDQVRPSMVAALIGVPKYVLTALVPVPIDIQQTQQNISDAQSKIVNSQAAGTTVAEQK